MPPQRRRCCLNRPVLTGHFKKEVSSGLTQNQACLTFGLAPRKFRRWSNSKPVKSRTAGNKILTQEHKAFKNAVYVPELLDKPLSHVFVHGHNTGKFFASLSTVFRVLESENFVKPLGFYRTRKTNYVSAHALMKEDYSLLCYDSVQFKTDSGVIVWAMPVLILLAQYLLHIG